MTASRAAGGVLDRRWRKTQPEAARLAVNGTVFSAPMKAMEPLAARAAWFLRNRPARRLTGADRPSHPLRVLRLLFLSLLGSLTAGAATLPPEQEAFWRALRGLCGQAFAGKVVESTSATDAAFAGQTLVMHVRACSETEIRIPFHVGANRSRTWVITRTPSGLRLKHDHRHEDGTEDKVTQYGGDTASAGTATQQDFPADAFTAELIPAARTNVWSFLLSSGKTLSYRLVRAAEGRRFRVEFDLTQPVAAPPAPWGHR